MILEIDLKKLLIQFQIMSANIYMSEPNEEKKEVTFKDIIIYNKISTIVCILIIILLIYDLDYEDIFNKLIFNKIIGRYIYFKIDDLPTGPTDKKVYLPILVGFVLVLILLYYMFLIYQQFRP